VPIDAENFVNGTPSITIVMKKKVADARSLRQQMIRISAPELNTFFTIRLDQNTTILQLK